jgi:hypothetical protein
MAQIVGLRYPTAPNPYNDIQLYVVYQDELPFVACTPDQRFVLDFTVAGIAFQYRIYPQCIDPKDMKVVYYTAYHRQRERVDYVIGPAQLDQFASKVEIYHIAANFFFGATNTASLHEINQYKLLQLMVKGEYKAALKQWGRGWLDALQDPLWWMQAGLSTVAAAESPAARAAAAKELGPATAQEARAMARAAGKEAFENGAGGVVIGKFGEPNSLFSRIETTGGRVTYRVTGIVAKDGMDNAAAVSARAAHREMIVQAAETAKRLGQTEFTMVGEQAGPNFVNHANKLAKVLGPPDAVRIVPRGPVPNCEVRLNVDAVLRDNGRLLDNVFAPAAAAAVAATAGQPVADAQKK